MRNVHCREIAVDETFQEDVRRWLAARSRTDMKWLLAHADDGVIWGRREDDGTLMLSSDIFGDPKEHPSIAVPLRAQTLQQARLFGEGGELLVWKGADGFSARLIEEDPRISDESMLEDTYLLWGRGRKDVIGGASFFTLLQEGQQGLRHAPPKPMPLEGRLALTVRHYLDFDEEDQAYIALSRLTGLTDWRKEK